MKFVATIIFLSSFSSWGEVNIEFEVREEEIVKEVEEE